MTFDYHDNRSDNTYTIVLDKSRRFVLAMRYIGSVASEPVEYEELDEIPQPHRGEIENLIEWHKKN